MKCDYHCEDGWLVADGILDVELKPYRGVWTEPLLLPVDWLPCPTCNEAWMGVGEEVGV